MSRTIKIFKTYIGLKRTKDIILFEHYTSMRSDNEIIASFWQIYVDH